MKRTELHAHWCGLIAEYEESGQTQREFAQTHGVGAKRLSRWVRKLGKIDATPNHRGNSGGLVKIVAPAVRSTVEGDWACRIETGAVTVYLQERPPAAAS